jgi:hypothetical protein
VGALQVEKNGVDKEFLPGKYEVVVEIWDELCGSATDSGCKTQKKRTVCSPK